MAIYHLSAKVISRGTGASALAVLLTHWREAWANIANERLADSISTRVSITAH